MQQCLFCSLTILVLAANNGETAKILGLFPYPGRSHFISYAPLLDELAKRGHQMTVVSAYPRRAPLENYKDVTIEDYFHRDGAPILNMFENYDVNIWLMMMIMRSVSLEYCEFFLNEPAIQNLIHSNDLHFDLIIYEPFITECAYGIIYKFKAPFIHVSSGSISKWMGDGVGNPFIYSYIPELILGYTQHMTLGERIYNTITQTFFDLERNFYTIPKMEALMKKYFNDPNLPSIHEIERNASFLLMNSHPAISYPRPLTPNTAEVGGMHLKEARTLPQDLQKLMNRAMQGVIYFSLGSNVRGADMPEEMRNHFLNAFSKLKQTVLWKWEADSLPEQPRNVYLSKWFPQSDILGHPHVRVFITHGGLLSTQEATYFGKPLIAVPIMADQKQNGLRAAAQGYAVVLDLKNVTEKSLDWALNEILENSRYRENARYLSTILRDQPEKPLDRAVYWTEYVLRHKGAPHMHSAALKLNFFQYHLLDVIVVILIVALTFLISSFVMCKLFFRCIFSKSSSKKSETQKKFN